MFTDFFYCLKNFGVPVSMNEWQTLMDALELGMAGSSLTGFYFLTRALLVKTEAHYDRFDLAFASYFHDVATPEGLPEKIWEWLDKELLPPEITEEMRQRHQQLNLDEMKRMLEKDYKSSMRSITEAIAGWAPEEPRPSDIQGIIRAVSVSVAQG